MRIFLSVLLCLFCYPVLSDVTYVGISDPTPTAELTALYEKLTGASEKVRYGTYFFPIAGFPGGFLDEGKKITGKDYSFVEYRLTPWNDDGTAGDLYASPDTVSAKTRYDAGAVVGVYYPVQNLSSTCDPLFDQNGDSIPDGGCGLTPYSNGAQNRSGNPCDALLSTGGDPTARALYLSTLDNFAHWATDAEHWGGRALIFRPFHENDGDWAWWGTNPVSACSDADYVQLWRETVDYLRNTKGVHNLLYAYSPEIIRGYTDYTGSRYPGDDYVDIFGIDLYASRDDWDYTGCDWYDCDIRTRYREVASDARTHGKIWAITEGQRVMRNADGTANSYGYRADYWTWFMDQILDDPILSDISYINLWPAQFCPISTFEDASNFNQMFLDRSDEVCFLNDDGTCYEPEGLPPGIYIR